MTVQFQYWRTSLLEMPTSVLSVALLVTLRTGVKLKSKRNLYGNVNIVIASSLHVLAVWFTRKSVRLKIRMLVVDVDVIRIGQKIVMRKRTLTGMLCKTMSFDKKTETFTRKFFHIKDGRKRVTQVVQPPCVAVSECSCCCKETWLPNQASYSRRSLELAST